MNKFLRPIAKLIPDKLFLSLKYRVKFGKKLDLNKPQTFNEKLQWLKLYNRNPEYTKLVDKYEVRKYVMEKIGEKYLIPLIGIWDNVDSIDFKKLPDQFVLKCTHDCGSVIICKNKNDFDFSSACKKLNEAMKINYYWGEREWPYKNIKPRIIAEKYLEEKVGNGLKDYKFFCFHGEIKAMFIATDRNVDNEEVKFDFFDENFNHLPLKNGHPNSGSIIEKPFCFETMRDLARILSRDIPHVRVDFYEVDGKIFFGEMTFFHFGGFVKFEPEEWDEKFGGWLKLPSEN